ncbi:MAG TPA: condensation domain-containing protein, partial [Blastocatellia bacterium]|nr:condensation domain-containing protein [Blastocatellia bacterium]
QSSPLPELSIQYADYAMWEREWLRGDVLGHLLAYWRRQLEGAPKTLELPFDRPRPKVRSLQGGMCSIKLSRSLTNELQTLSKSENATLYMTLLTAFNVLLGAYSGQRDIVVGTPIANRGRVETEGVIGFFVNTLVIRTDLSGDPTFSELLRRIRETALGAYAHQDLPFEKLVEELKPPRDPGIHPLFQVMFGLNTIPGASATLAGVNVDAFEINNTTAKFDLLFNLEETPEGLIGAMDYSSDLFDAGAISEMLDCYESLLNRLVKKPEIRLSELVKTVSDAVEQGDRSREDELGEVRMGKFANTRRKAIVGSQGVNR